MTKQEITFEQVVARGCGIDVHKNLLVASIRGTGIPEQTRDFEAFTESIEELRDWLKGEGVTHVAMESTGIYWKPVYNIMEEDFEVILVNARHIKNVPGHKTDKKDVTVHQLLSHSSGLPAYRPYFETLRDMPQKARAKALRKALIREPLVNKPGSICLYSDLGFMILGWIVEALAGKRLDRFITETLYRPMGLNDLFFVDINGPMPVADFAATEVCPWRRRLIVGQVHDDNAWAAGGICGHAGLFGTAADVLSLAKALLAARGGQSAGGLNPDLMHHFSRRAGTDGRPLGFDAPAPMDSSCGRHFSTDSFGHLGFTGTSFWIDPRRQVAVVLLTNRVHPTRDNLAIKQFRPRLHDALMQALGPTR